jgi:Co/Zn/Cd efflux system component
VASPGAPPTVRSPSLRLQSPRSPRTTAALFVSSGALAVAAGVFGALTYDAYRDHRDTNIQVTADDADHRFRTYGLASATLLTAAIAAAALALYVGWRSPPHGDR